MVLRQPDSVLSTVAQHVSTGASVLTVSLQASASHAEGLDYEYEIGHQLCWQKRVLNNHASSLQRQSLTPPSLRLSSRSSSIRSMHSMVSMLETDLDLCLFPCLYVCLSDASCEEFFSACHIYACACPIRIVGQLYTWYAEQRALGRIASPFGLLCQSWPGSCF